MFELVLIGVNLLFDWVDSDLALAWHCLERLAGLDKKQEARRQLVLKTRATPQHTGSPHIKTTLKATHSHAKCFASCRLVAIRLGPIKCPKPLGVLNGSDRITIERSKKQEEAALASMPPSSLFDPIPINYNKIHGRSRPTLLTISSYTSQYPIRLDAPSHQASERQTLAASGSMMMQQPATRRRTTTAAAATTLAALLLGVLARQASAFAPLRPLGGAAPAAGAWSVDVLIGRQGRKGVIVPRAAE